MIEVVTGYGISEEPKKYGATRAYTIKDFLLVGWRGLYTGWRGLYRGVTVAGKPSVVQHVNVIDERQTADHDLLLKIAEKLGVEPGEGPSS